MTQHSLLDRLFWFAAVLVLPVIVAELVLPGIPGSTSTKLSLGLVGLAVLSNRQVAINWRWAAHAAVFGLYLALAMIREGFVFTSFFRADLEVGLQGLMLSAAILPLLASDEDRARFFRQAGVLLVMVGLSAALLGILKLYLQTSGVLLPWLEWQGIYPRGTSLRIDYNVYAFGLIISLVAAIAVRSSVHGGAIARAVALVAIPVIFLTVTLTSSRRGVLFLLLTLPVMAASVPSPRERLRALWMPVVSLAGAAALIVALLLSSDSLWLARLSEYLDVARAAERVLAVSESGQLVETRAPLVLDAWSQVTREHGVTEAILGRGDVYLQEMGRVFNREVEYEYPHNLVLSSLLHGGLLFTAAVLVALASAGVNAWRMRGEDRWGFGVFVFAVLFGLTSVSTVYSFDVLVLLTLLFGVGPSQLATPPMVVPGLRSGMAA